VDRGLRRRHLAQRLRRQRPALRRPVAETQKARIVPGLFLSFLDLCSVIRCRLGIVAFRDLSSESAFLNHPNTSPHQRSTILNDSKPRDPRSKMQKARSNPGLLCFAGSEDPAYEKLLLLEGHWNAALRAAERTGDGRSIGGELSRKRPRLRVRQLEVQLHRTRLLTR